jgi:hypothetical protein
MVDEVEVFDVSDIAERTVKTALEAFVIALPTAIVFTDLPALAATASAAAFGAATAGAAVVLNVVLQFSRSRKSKVQL